MRLLEHSTDAAECVVRGCHRSGRLISQPGEPAYCEQHSGSGECHTEFYENALRTQR